MSFPTQQVEFGLRLDLQGFVHWYAIEGRVFQGQFPVSSVLNRVDPLFFGSRDRRHMTSNEIMINHVTTKFQYRGYLPGITYLGSKLHVCWNLVVRACFDGVRAVFVQCREQGGPTWQKANDTIAISRPVTDQGIL